MFEKLMIKYHRAASTDNLIQMARLLHATDRFIYPYWRKDEAEFARFLKPWMKVDGFIFNYRNFFIANQKRDPYPLAIMVTLDNSTPNDFDYNCIRQLDPHSEFIVDHYLQDIVDAARELPNGVAYGVALSVSPVLRGRGIGSDLFQGCLEHLKQRGINTLCFDCLEDNTPARNMYEKLGFEAVGDGIGFDGTDHSTIKTVTYASTF